MREIKNGNLRIRIEPGIGDHAGYGSITRATWLLMQKNGITWVEPHWCEECQRYHVGTGGYLDVGGSRVKTDQSVAALAKGAAKTARPNQRL
jgi:hypothetical protein